jgi:hypothetical protein
VTPATPSVTVSLSAKDALALKWSVDHIIPEKSPFASILRGPIDWIAHLSVNSFKASAVTSDGMSGAIGLQIDPTVSEEAICSKSDFSIEQSLTGRRAYTRGCAGPDCYGGSGRSKSRLCSADCNPESAILTACGNPGERAATEVTANG